MALFDGCLGAGAPDFYLFFASFSHKSALFRLFYDFMNASRAILSLWDQTMHMLCCVIPCVMIMTPATNINTQYNSASLLNLRPSLDSPLLAKFVTDVGRLREQQASHNEKEYYENKTTKKHCKRRSGPRSGVRLRMRRRGMKTPLPAITFGSARSIRNKMDELCTNCNFIQEYRDSAIIAITETWLQDRDADSSDY